MEETWQLRVRLGVQRLGKLEAELKKIPDEGRREEDVWELCFTGEVDSGRSVLEAVEWGGVAMVRRHRIWVGSVSNVNKVRFGEEY